MTNLVNQLTQDHLQTLKTAVKAAQTEYLTSNISDEYSVAVIVDKDLNIYAGYNVKSSDDQIRVHICSRGSEAKWTHFAQEQDTLDGFLRRKVIILGRKSFAERLEALEQHFPLAFIEYQQQTLNWILTEFWPSDEIIDIAINQYQKLRSA